MTIVNVAHTYRAMTSTVLITGAAVRIGRAIAETLARSGWRVVVHARRSLEAADALCVELRAAGAQAWRVEGDLQAPDGPERVFAAAVQAAGTVDALVNNASLFARQPLDEATAEAFDTQWRVNTLAPVLLAQRLRAHLAARGARGCVVNLLDQRVARPSAGAIPYLLSKKALEAFTGSAALEWAPSVRVNAVAPGAVLPPVGADGREAAGTFPLGARATPEDVAGAVRYLLEARSVTGQTLFVDGGQHLTP